MLTSISEYNRADALILLRWITYAKSPLTLYELAEATIILPADKADVEDIVDVDNRGGWTDTLAVLTGLVTTQSEQDDRNNQDSIHVQMPTEVTGNTKIRLAHFLVQEFLESTRILASNIEMFHLDPAREHGFLAQSCLAYLHHYSGSAEKCNNVKDLETFRLLEYVSKTWFYHAKLQQQDESNRLAISLLTSEGKMRDWLAVHQPDERWEQPFDTDDRKFASNGLYYASYLGLGKIANQLLEGADVNAVNARGGACGTALQAASVNGHIEIVTILLENGADVNLQGGEYYDSALQAASHHGHVETVTLLLDGGADVNAQGGYYDTALQAASHSDHLEIVTLLLDGGADVNAQGGHYGNALQATLSKSRDNVKVFVLLLDRGADVNAQGGVFGNALQAASFNSLVNIVEVLLARGADANAQGGSFGNALQAASTNDQVKVITLLLDKGAADVNAQGGMYRNALRAASLHGDIEIVTLLLDKGAVEVEMQGSKYETVLQGALRAEHHEVAALLRTRGFRYGDS
jgi:ankyrin repeat protein